MRRVSGVELDLFWTGLSIDDRRQVVKELTTYVRAVSEITLPYFQSAEGLPKREPTLLDHSYPTDKNMYDPIPEPLPGPLTVAEFRANMRLASEGVEPPEMDPPLFHLYHNDMSPGNIFLSGTDIPKEKGCSHVHVSAIIDWERTGFYPRFWITQHMDEAKENFWLSYGDPDDLRRELKLSLEQVEFPGGDGLRDWWSRHHKGRWNFINRKWFDRRATETAKTA